MRLGVSTGGPEPLGVTPQADGVNVAVFSAHAGAIEFCLFDATGNIQTHAVTLPGRAGDVFHGFIKNLPVGARYGLRVYGPDAPAQGHRFNPAKLLVDPYALALDRPFALDARLYGFGEQLGADSAAAVPKGIVTSRKDLALPRAPVRVPWAETVIYELHVRGFTKLHPDIPEALRGTFAALAEPAAIAHLRGLGITTIELLPAAAWIDERHLPPLGLSNYWGYNPVALMAPDPRLAPGGWPEIRRATDALHAAGLEVILDIVLNHSGESDEFGPTISLRGLDNASYYRLRPDDPARYINDMGCGNCLALNNPLVLRLAMDALRTWVELGGFDGFRFDLATAMGRLERGFDPAAPLLTAISQDPVLRNVKLIAEPWDVGPGGYQLGRFPAAYGEWNDRFRDDIRRVWRGDLGRRGALATRLAGSADLFGAKRLASRGINFITAHDGFTLADLVSYASKHNEANGEQNRDGGQENFSWNHGVEGPGDASLQAVRRQDQRNLLATLLLARGTPMLAMGAELGATQHGNNNAYAQDNRTTWLDWANVDEALLEFTRKLIALRQAHPALRGEPFLTGLVDEETSLPDVEWRSARGPLSSAADWEDITDPTLVAVFARGDAERVAVALNPGAKPVEVILPPARPGWDWRRVLDTAPEASGTGLAARAVVVFVEEAISLATTPPDDRLLGRLANAAGIAPDWWDVEGNRHAVSLETQRALLRAMGLEASTRSRARDSLARIAAMTTGRALPVSHMVHAGEVGVLPVARGRGEAWPKGSLILRDEAGNTAIVLVRWDRVEARLDTLGQEISLFHLTLPALPAGHYLVAFEDDADIVCHLTAAPRQCFVPAALSRQHFGISVQSYALRRAGDAGIGDFAALADFAAAAGHQGASLLGIQPLHMLFPADRARASPYHPSDRRYLDPIHLATDRLTDIPGFEDVPPLVGETPPAAGLIDFRTIWTEKSRFLEALFARFALAETAQPGHPAIRAFQAFINAGGFALSQFAAFQVISQLHPGLPWQTWPEPLRDANSTAVVEVTRAHRNAHRYAMFLQFLCAGQLRAVAAAAREAGMALGLYRDLAVGCAPDGAEAWANAGLFAQGASIGAPPDPLGPNGQVWGLPPPDPLAWQRTNYASFRAGIAANMHQAGALRIDHAMGLARLFWVPEGAQAIEGAYVRYPVDALIGQLALASQTAGCLVIGEDLGTVPEGFRETLAAARILSYRVMLLEREGVGFTPPRRYPAQALACAATHDLPPLAGWWRGADIDERHLLGLIDAPTHASLLAHRVVEKAALLAAMASDGIPIDDVPGGELSAAMLAALCAWLAQAPSALLMVQAEDLAGETASQNLPGTDQERPNWRHRLAPTVTALLAAPRAQDSLAALRAGNEG